MNWSVQDARKLYNLTRWSEGYFDISDTGHLCCTPGGERSQPPIDLTELTEQVRKLGMQLPVLVRFSDILQQRTRELDAAFEAAIASCDYTGAYTPAYPIKVNQQRHVIEAIVATDNIDVALEAGSKAELLAAIALAPAGGTVICNGFKDAETIRIALTGQLLGLRVFIVIEKPSELEIILTEAKHLDVVPRLGLRARLTSIAAGKWQNTGGDKSKFGLSASQILQLIHALEKTNALATLQFLHVHIGSQIPNIDDIATALGEAAHLFAELHAAGVNIDHLDVGGGLGVDYEGTASTAFCSMNYAMADYAKCIVDTLAKTCADKQLPMPHLYTEAGRAMTAHHAVVITNVIQSEQSSADIAMPGADEADSIAQLRALLDHPNPDSDRQLDALADCMRTINRAFANAGIDLKQRATAETISQLIMQKMAADAPDAEPILIDKTLCNFSLFQTIPDSWAIDQIFPVLPLQRLNEPPDRHTTIHDLTCDSDGRINHYAGPTGINASMPLHSITEGEEYLIGIFLVGAYQEILGDVHNLFGDLNSVHVELDANNEYQLTNPLRGDSVASVLGQVNINARTLREELDRRIATADIDSELQIRCSEILEQGLNTYTYLKSGDSL